MLKVLASLLFIALALSPAKLAPIPSHARCQTSSQAQKCFQIHGRAIFYRGDGVLAIWHIGTHHIFNPADKKSWNLLCSYLDCESTTKQPALFANFTVCPTVPYKKGSAQPVIVTKVTHPYVVPDWPAMKHH